MDCLINLLTVCLFNPSGIYMTAGLEFQMTNRDPVRVERCYEVAYCTRPAYSGPIGTLKLGMASAITERLTLDYGLEHRSYTDTNRDRGQEFAYLNVTWRPFR